MPLVTLENIDLSAGENTGLGDPLRTGGNKINQNQSKLFVLARVTQAGTLQVFKALGNEDIFSLEPGDAIRGWWSANLFIEFAIYNGGNVGDLASYTVIDKYDF